MLHQASVELINLLAGNLLGLKETFSWEQQPKIIGLKLHNYNILCCVHVCINLKIKGKTKYE